jgi:hypothetical protein
MLDYIRENTGTILDGLLFGLGILAVYVGAIFSGALIRSLAGAGSSGIKFAGRYVQGWWDYLRGDNRDVVNITLNMVVDGHLKFDTLVADRKIWLVWPNAYRAQLIRRAAKKTTIDNPVITFPDAPPPPKSRFGKVGHWCGERVNGMLTSAKIVENGKVQRVRLQREDEYRATYGPLISLVSENCSNEDSIDLALGRRMVEYRFVVALTFEQLSNRRARHLRAMVIWEPTLRTLPAECPTVEREEHKTRFRTLQAIARQYARNPDRFGIVHVWRPMSAASVVPGTVSESVPQPQLKAAAAR